MNLDTVYGGAIIIARLEYPSEVHQKESSLAAEILTHYWQSRRSSSSYADQEAKTAELAIRFGEIQVAPDADADEYKAQNCLKVGEDPTPRVQGSWSPRSRTTQRHDVTVVTPTADTMATPFCGSSSFRRRGTYNRTHAQNSSRWQHGSSRSRCLLAIGPTGARARKHTALAQPRATTERPRARCPTRTHVPTAAQNQTRRSAACLTTG